jgi:hypothetical protein
METLPAPPSQTQALSPSVTGSFDSVQAGGGLKNFEVAAPEEAVAAIQVSQSYFVMLHWKLFIREIHRFFDT